MAYNWPTTKAQDILIREMKSDPRKFRGMEFCPIKETQDQILEWYVKSSPQGLTPPHALGADPKMLKHKGAKLMRFDPAYFKESKRFDESDMLKLRNINGAENQRYKAQEQVAEALEELNTRIENRLEWMRWQVALTGEIHISEADIEVHAEYGIPAGNLDRPVSVAWSDKANSKPVEDINKAKLDFIGSGYGLEQIWMNSNTATLFAFSKDTKTYFSGAGVNEKIMPSNLENYYQSKTPGVKMAIYDEGYEDEDGVYQLYIPDNKIVLLGGAPKGEIMDFVSTPSLHTPNGEPRPGKFAFSIEKSGENSANPIIDVVAGIYGLIRVRRPNAIMTLDVTQT